MSQKIKNKMNVDNSPNFYLVYKETSTHSGEKQVNFIKYDPRITQVGL